MNFVELFWSSTPPVKLFKPYGIDHILALIFAVLIGVIIVRNRKKWEEEKYKKRIKIPFIIVLIIHQFMIYSWYISSGHFNVQESLPLYLCRISAILALVLLITESKKVFDVLYFWGLGGALVALIFPDTGGYVFPHIMYIQFFTAHSLIVLSVCYMMALKGYKPDRESFKRTVVWTIIYVCVVVIVNNLTGANYCFFRQKPITPTPIDYLPPYPFYVPSWILLFLSGFYLMYLPFKIINIRKKSKKNEIQLN